MAGSDYERRFVTLLDDLGYGVMRAPGSGGATARDMPDVLFAEPDENGHADAYAVEMKTGRDTTLYADETEVAGLTRFCAAFGAKPRLGFRHTRQATTRDYFLVKPSNSRRTDSGNYGLPLDGIKDRASEVFHP